MPLDMNYKYVGIVLVCGALAGLAHAATTMVLVEPYLDAAIQIENQRLFVSGPDPQLELVLEEYRMVQKTGMVISGLFIGAASAALFGIIYWAVRDGLPGRTGFQKGMLLGVVFWAILNLSLFFKYPAELPGVGDPETLALRTILALSLVGLLGAGALACYLWHQRIRRHAASIVVLYCIFAGILYVAMPASPDANSALPGIEEFRMAALSASAIFWTLLGLLVGYVWSRYESIRQIRV